MATLRELRSLLVDGPQKFWSMQDLKSLIGVKDARTAKRIFCTGGLDVYQIGKTPMYYGGDIAKRLDSMKEATQ